LADRPAGLADGATPTWRRVSGGTVMCVLRPWAIVAVLVLAVGIVSAASATVATAYIPTVTMIDNDAPAPSQAIEIGQAYWGYGPDILHVKKGEQVTFVNPATNKRPHSVTSISLGGMPFENNLVAGARFDSSPTRETLVSPGNSWTLDTTDLDAGNYAYYCRIHPWMVAQITVLPE
jgi:plastocyanin